MTYSIFDEINSGIKGDWKRVKCVIIHTTWNEDPKEAVILKTGWTDADLAQFKEQASKRTANSGWSWGNHVWETDGSWWGYENRDIYNGLPEWTHHQVPEIPDECQEEVE